MPATFFPFLLRISTRRGRGKCTGGTKQYEEVKEWGRGHSSSVRLVLKWFEVWETHSLHLDFKLLYLGGGGRLILAVCSSPFPEPSTTRSLDPSI